MRGRPQHLRAEPNLDDIRKLEREFSCERLRPQILRLARERRPVKRPGRSSRPSPMQSPLGPPNSSVRRITVQPSRVAIITHRYVDIDTCSTDEENSHERYFFRWSTSTPRDPNA